MVAGRCGGLEAQGKEGDDDRSFLFLVTMLPDFEF